MNTRKLIRHPLFMWLIACAIFPLLLTACQPVSTSTSLPPEQPTAIQPPTATQTATQATKPPLGVSADIILDLSGVAQDQTVETVEAVPASADGPWWDPMPQYRRVTLQGYPVTARLMKPQIFIYPVADLARFNEGAGRIATDLQSLLQAQKTVDPMPFLPLFNAQQLIHAQAKYLDFKSGKGVRFLTQIDQGPLPINNYELIYTFQGLTSDGQYYIAAVLPVTYPELPATAQVSTQQVGELNDFPAYLTKTVAWLDQQPGSSFTPDLAKLDALIQSLEVK